MTSVLSVSTAVLLIVCLSTQSISSVNGASATRTCHGLASYQLTLNTLWSKETFETQYPLYRPAAQWSKLVGRSHSRRYTQWSLEKVASEALKEFSEQGLSNGFDMESQGSAGIYDAFVGLNISTGVGTSNVKFLAHPNYPKLSFVVRMIPSPDWFIGVDSVDLCTGDGQWKSDLTLDLHPMDAGTDRGFTFTSPNWPETPSKPIYIITSKHPNHPSSSFFYPDLDSLPPIGQLQLTKIDVDWIEDTTNDTVALLPDASPVRGSNVEYYRESKPTLAKSVPAGAALQSPSKASASKTVEVKKEVQTNNGRKVVRRTRINSHTQNRQSSVSSSKSHVDSAAGGGQPVACELSDWNDWTPCSKTCGFGTRTRTRPVIRHPSNGGLPCSILREEQLCGSMRSCGWQYFSRTNQTSSAASRG